MALVQFGAIVTRLSGKIGGQTFGNAKGGNYIKNTGTYTVSRSSAAQAARASFAGATGAWRTLDNTQKQAWRDAGAQYTYVNRVGQLKQLTGFAYFGKINIARVNAGEEIYNTPPALPAFDAIGISGLSLGANSVTFTVQPFSATSELVYSATDWQSIQPSNAPTSYEQIAVIASTGATQVYSNTVDYQAIWSQWPGDSIIYFRFQLRDIATGILSNQIILQSATYVP